MKNTRFKLLTGEGALRWMSVPSDSSWDDFILSVFDKLGVPHQKASFLCDGAEIDDAGLLRDGDTLRVVLEAEQWQQETTTKTPEGKQTGQDLHKAGYRGPLEMLREEGPEGLQESPPEEDERNNAGPNQKKQEKENMGAEEEEEEDPLMESPPPGFTPIRAKRNSNGNGTPWRVNSDETEADDETRQQEGGAVAGGLNSLNVHAAPFLPRHNKKDKDKRERRDSHEAERETETTSEKEKEKADVMGEFRKSLSPAELKLLESLSLMDGIPTEAGGPSAEGHKQEDFEAFRSFAQKMGVSDHLQRSNTPSDHENDKTSNLDEEKETEGEAREAVEGSDEKEKGEKENNSAVDSLLRKLATLTQSLALSAATSATARATVSTSSTAQSSALATAVRGASSRLSFVSSGGSSTLGMLQHQQQQQAAAAAMQQQQQQTSRVVVGSAGGVIRAGNAKGIRNAPLPLPRLMGHSSGVMQRAPNSGVKNGPPGPHSHQEGMGGPLGGIGKGHQQPQQGGGLLHTHAAGAGGHAHAHTHTQSGHGMPRGGGGVVGGVSPDRQPRCTVASNVEGLSVDAKGFLVGYGLGGQLCEKYHCTRCGLNEIENGRRMQSCEFCHFARYCGEACLLADRERHVETQECEQFQYKVAAYNKAVWGSSAPPRYPKSVRSNMNLNM
uniref:Ubiquitin-like domain-containing protein n=1 Tax=Chromera velia CCMP2878 TaxID=1169474 RepID=A0A0G4HCT8_9ALVE|eukprot:Cvel_26318.t1-p1 / transcript=Cvel_26318.t1 / gene=Cvel_26318 / organism=Chromera_velia_CCMP2878 / gene_product=hypothetical protein / transcript_product=hypothetical protein / location=Cvel_scaffold3110:2923-13433(+) / protein_length=668 / sequence_SO=supercontig / SO=protein_coding / is_pseudo=false